MVDSLRERILGRIFASKELGVMENAPWAVVKIALALLIVEGIVLWWFLSWHYKELIAAKDVVIATKTTAIENSENLQRAALQAKDATIEAKDTVIENAHESQTLALKANEERLQAMKDLVEEYREQLHLSPAANRYGNMSTARLVASAKEFVGKLRKEEEVYSARSRQLSDERMEAIRKATTEEERQTLWQNMNSRDSQFYEEQRARWDREYKSEAVLIREEMLARLPKETREKMTITHGAYAMGGWSGMVADELEMFADILTKEPPQP